MKKTALFKPLAALLLVGPVFHAMPAPVVFADRPSVSAEVRERRSEERRRAEEARREAREAARPRADVWTRTGGVGEIGLVFKLSGPGECEYTLRGPLSAGGTGPVAAEGRDAWAGPGEGYLVREAAIPPALEENETGRYGLEAVCRLKVMENTTFGPKATNREEETRINREFRLRRRSIYQVRRIDP